MVTDEGILAIASADGCINLELIDLKASLQPGMLPTSAHDGEFSQSVARFHVDRGRT